MNAPFLTAPLLKDTPSKMPHTALNSSVQNLEADDRTTLSPFPFLTLSLWDNSMSSLAYCRLLSRVFCTLLVLSAFSSLVTLV